MGRAMEGGRAGLPLGLMALLMATLLLGCAQERGYQCADGRWVDDLSKCPEFQKYVCPDGRVVNKPEECGPACDVQSVHLSFLSKVHPDEPRMKAVADAAVEEFLNANDAEAVFFREQLRENLISGAITQNEHDQIMTAISIFRFVRDNITLTDESSDLKRLKEDVKVLEEGRGGAGEKAILYASLLKAKGLNPMVGVGSRNGTNCAVEPCSCMAEPEFVVGIELPGFSKLKLYGKATYTDLTYCFLGSRVFVDPSCSHCPFAYGNVRNCNSSRIALYP